MATNGGPEKKQPQPAGGNKKPRDETIAKAAAAVVAGGIAWSLFKTVQMRIGTQKQSTIVSQEEKRKSHGATEQKKGLDFFHFGHKKQQQPSGDKTVVQVSAGDTLWGIARKYDVSVEALMASNGIQNGESIAAGESLIVPK